MSEKQLFSLSQKACSLLKLFSKLLLCCSSTLHGKGRVQCFSEAHAPAVQVSLIRWGGSSIERRFGRMGTKWAQMQHQPDRHAGDPVLCRIHQWDSAARTRENLGRKQGEHRGAPRARRDARHPSPSHRLGCPPATFPAPTPAELPWRKPHTWRGTPVRPRDPLPPPRIPHGAYANLLHPPPRIHHLLQPLCRQPVSAFAGEQKTARGRSLTKGGRPPTASASWGDCCHSVLYYFQHSHRIRNEISLDPAHWPPLLTNFFKMLSTFAEPSWHPSHSSMYWYFHLASIHVPYWTSCPITEPAGPAPALVSRIAHSGPLLPRLPDTTSSGSPFPATGSTPSTALQSLLLLKTGD